VNQPLLPPELKTLAPGELFVNEVFHSIQGESTFTGQPCYFIRLAGCHLRCTWCDSEYAFHEGKVMRVEECVELARASGARLVEVIGGEPLLQPAVHPLLTALCDSGHEVLLETSGAIGIAAVDPRVRRIVDWKCPGSGMESHNKPSVLLDLRAGDELKLVLDGRGDYEWAREWLRGPGARLPPGVTVNFSPAFGRLAFHDLAAWILEDRLPVRLNLQIHKWIWDPAARGV
jgi:7-carboxy-7-deazaguanine synthase